MPYDAALPPPAILPSLPIFPRPRPLDRVVGEHHPRVIRVALTVIARTPATLYGLERNDFLEAVTGHPESAAVADAVSRTRFEDKRAEIAGAAHDPASTSVGHG
jgi:hypothetical protein